jgi:hypothetical protein
MPYNTWVSMSSTLILVRENGFLVIALFLNASRRIHLPTSSPTPIWFFAESACVPLMLLPFTEEIQEEDRCIR